MPEAPDAYSWGAVILAAGASRRMGRPKQLLTIGSETLVARAAGQALEAEFWPVVVVLGADRESVRAALSRLPVLCVDNPAWMEGMASSVRAGISTLEQFSRRLPGALIALCDQPAFDASVARALRASAAEAAEGVGAARYAGHLGVPACFRRKHFAALAALTGEQGARSFLQEHAADAASLDLPDLAIDFDTPGDYARYTK